MATIEIGCGQITWSNGTPEEQVLAEIAQAGYAGAPASPSKGRTTEQAQTVFARHGLKPAPGYLGVDFWRADQHDSHPRTGARVCGVHARGWLHRAVRCGRRLHQL